MIKNKYPHKITIYITDIYDDEKFITDTVQVSKTIKKHLSHLGDMRIISYREPKTFWEKLISGLSLQRYI